MNIAEIYEIHYLPEKSKKRRASTVNGYDSSVRKHVLPRWGACEIEDIDPDDLQAWVDGFALAGAAEKAFKCLRQIIRWWVKAKRLRAFDPTVYVELPAKAPHRPDTLDASELVEMQRGFWGHDLEALVLVVCPPKTPKSQRSGWLPKYALRRLKKICKGKSSLLAGLNPDQAARRIKAFCKRHKLPWVSMTNLRHTWATLAVEAGVGIETVAMMLGHTDIGTAYEHYIVPRKTICQAAQDAVERLLVKSAGKPKPLPAAA